MKALVQDGYGSPDVLALRDIDPPPVDERGVLVRVHAASVNALDWHATRGMPFLIRIDQGLRRPKHAVRGVDLSGRVETVGREVTGLAPGDEVFGGCDGSFAEYAVTTADRLAPKPAGFTHEQAAALHVAGLTAWQGLQEKARVRPGQRVLINGAGGGVGTFAVQIARWLGAHVTAVTRTESVEMVRALGADEVIDHQAADFTRPAGDFTRPAGDPARWRERYDVLFDIGGNRPFADLRRVMAPGGTIVTVGGPAGRWLAPADRMAKAAILSPFVSQRLIPFVSRNDHASLSRVAELAEAGEIRTVIDRAYPLDEAAEAIRYVGEGHARGKVAVEVIR